MLFLGTELCLVATLLISQQHGQSGNDINVARNMAWILQG